MAQEAGRIAALGESVLAFSSMFERVEIAGRAARFSAMHAAAGVAHRRAAAGLA
jgi:hypothetical protein